MTDIDVEAERARTPGCAHRNHLNHAGSSLMTTETLAAMTDHLRLEAEIGGYEAADERSEQVDAVYASLARLVGGRPEQIAYFDNSSHAWGAAFYSTPLGPGDRILTGRDEYGSNVLAYLQVTQRTGAEVVVVPDDEHGQIDLDALRSLLDERVKLVGLTWVPTAGGLVNPAAEVGAVVREGSDALYLLDATQVVGQLPIDVTTLGCDLLNGTGRKFLRGPRGTGFLWVGDRALDRLVPHVAEIRSAAWDGELAFRWEDGARRFETWENSYAAVLGLGSAVDQALAIGLDPISRRCVELGARLRERLDGLPGVRTHDLGVERCAIVTMSVEGRTAEEVAAHLAGRRINVSVTDGEDNQLEARRGVHPLVRLSPHYVTTEDELDQTAEAVAQLSRG